MSLRKNKIALVYDRVNTPFGGAEQVLVALHELFPNAPLFTSVYDSNQAKWAKVFGVRPSFLQHIPFAKSHHRQFVALMPKAFESLELKEFDIVLSISSAEAKGVLTHANQLHVCYLLTPTRYLWSHYLEYETGILKPLKAFIFSQLRFWDFKAAQRPNHLISISNITANRTKKYYKREVNAVVYPPFVPLPTVDELPTKPSELYFLIVSRLVPYKNIDLAIKVCIKNKWNLKIVGKGPEKDRLVQLVQDLDGENFIHFLEGVSSQELAYLYSQAKAFVLPNEEDFGIAGLEALSAGCPLITSEKSGVGELVTQNKTGLLLKSITVETLEQALHQSKQIHWQKKAIAESVMEYNKASFQKKFLKILEDLWESHLKNITST